MTAIPAARQIPRVRWGIGVLLGAGILVNYFDRINLSVGGPLQQEFGLTDSELGWLFSGLFWPYAVMQIPTGMILDRFGVTWVESVEHVSVVRRVHCDRLSASSDSAASRKPLWCSSVRGSGQKRGDARTRSAPRRRRRCARDTPVG